MKTVFLLEKKNSAEQQSGEYGMTAVQMEMVLWNVHNNKCIKAAIREFIVFHSFWSSFLSVITTLHST